MCKMAQCPYFDSQGFCGKRDVVSINESGMCSVLWKNGQPRSLSAPPGDSIYIKNIVTVLDADFKEIKEENNNEQSGKKTVNEESTQLQESG